MKRDALYGSKGSGSMIKFVTPQLQHEKLAQEYMEEHRRYGEYTLHGSALLDSERSYDQWVGIRGMGFGQYVFCDG